MKAQELLDYLMDLKSRGFLENQDVVVMQGIEREIIDVDGDSLRIRLELKPFRNPEENL